MIRTTAIAFFVFVTLTVFIGSRSAIGKEVPLETPEQLEQWSFLVGDWTMDTQRYSLDGPVLEQNAGVARFTMALEGLRIQERQSTTMAGKPVLVLNLFGFHPEKKEWEIARTDSLHHSFKVMRGTGDERTIVLFERNPRPDSEVTRRVTYAKISDDEFSRLLEFSLDRGKSWVRRNQTRYTRRR